MTENEGTTDLTDEDTDTELVENGKTDTEANIVTDESEVNYEFNFPEGFDVDDVAVGDFKTLAKEYRLSNEQAQKLVDMQTKLAKAASDKMLEAWQTNVESWRKAAAQDQEYGGANYKANLAMAREAIRKFGSDELRKAFNETGMGNHPELIRFMYRVGKAISEDTMKAGSPEVQARDAAHILYPNLA